jgi:predicted metalloprotease with PDZ domain
MKSLATFAALLSTASALAQTGPVMYDVDLTRSGEQVIRVKMTLQGVTTPTVDVHLPVWRPGLYLILDQAGTVRQVKAATAEGAPLEIEKTEKSSWRVQTGSAQSVVVEYDVWAASLDNRTRHADDTHAFFNPATVLMYAHEWRNLPADVKLTLPVREGGAAWRVSSGLGGSGRIADDRWELSAPNYDILADSPIEAGVHHVINFDVDGKPHEIAVWTGEPSTEGSQIRARATKWDNLGGDFAKIVEAQREIFGSLPYDKYVFLLHCYPGGRGGTEHWNSTIMQTSPEAIRDAERYRSFLSLVSHEMFHTWNVKRFRPQGMTPYDYQRENYTTLLWVSEGMTTYYEDVVLVRAGLMTRSRFLDSLARTIRTEQTKLGSRVQSVAHSSYDAWIKFNKRTADASNSTVSFYDKGALVSFLLDMEIRSRKPGASLDTVSRRLFERFPTPDKGFSEADLRAIIAEVAECPPDAEWIETFFRTAVHGTGQLDFNAALAVVGREYRAEPGEKALPYLGVTATDESGVARVTIVATDSPALRPDLGPGLVPGDILVAIDGRRLRAADLDKEIGLRAVGDSVRLAFFRHDVLRETVITIGGQPDVSPSIRKLDEVSDEQKKQFDSWLGKAGD